MLKFLGFFQGFHYAHHFGLNRHARDQLSDSPHFTACAHLTDRYDHKAHPDLPESAAVFLRTTGGAARDQSNPKGNVAWKAGDLEQYSNR